MIAETAWIAEAMQVYAKDQNDHELALLVAVSPSSLQSMRDNILLERCRLICRRGKAVEDQLDYYGVSPEDLARLDKEINDFKAVIEHPRHRVTKLRTATKDLKKLFAYGNELLNERLDPLSGRFRTKDPGFYEAYNAARTISDRGGSQAPTGGPPSASHEEQEEAP